MMKAKQEQTEGVALPENARIPTIGQLMLVHGQFCKIVSIHDFGTVDVESPSGRNWYRVTGLPFVNRGDV